MARPSILSPLAGPLAGQRLEVHGGEVVIGSGLDCAVRIVAPGIEAQHARIVIDVTGATIYAIGGVVGVNDDVVGGAALLRSGDFVWLGEPGGALSLMLQFTLGDVEEAGAVAAPFASLVESPSEELVEEVSSDDLAPQSSGADVPLVSEADPAATASGFEMMEMAPEQWIEEAQPQMEPADLAPITELEQFFPASMDEPPSGPAPSAVVPPAPWHMPSSTAAPEPAAEYASAWESAVSPAAPVDTESTVLLQASAEEAPAPAPAAPRRPVTAPTLRIKARTVEQDAALRTPMPPPPPARTTASTPMIVGGLGLLVVLGIVGLLSLRPSPEPVAPSPTPAPTPMVESTPAAAEPTPVEPTPVTEPTQVPVVEPTPAKPLATAAPTVAPTPRVAATPPPKPTSTANATPTPPATRPGAVAPTVAPASAPPAAPVSQAPRLLEEARAAVAARDYPRAVQLLDQVLRIEPGNAEATARKSEVDARIAILGRKFSAGATTVLGGKSAKGLTGFDLGGGAVVKTDFSAQIRCTITPASVEPGMTYSVRCSIVNIGTKAFKLESVATNESTDGAKVAGTGVFPRQDLPPQSDTVILQKSGTWTAKSQWSMEIVAKTSKDESFRAVQSWR